MRLIHAVRDLNAATRETGGHQIEVIALHTEGEKRAMFVREADVAYDLGPAANRPYLDHALLERALTQTRADAAWVGWGFVAEDPAFVPTARGDAREAIVRPPTLPRDARGGNGV